MESISIPLGNVVRIETFASVLRVVYTACASARKLEVEEAALEESDLVGVGLRGYRLCPLKRNIFKTD